MRAPTFILAAAMLVAAPLAAQTTAMAIGHGARAEIRITAAANVPVILQTQETEAFVQTYKGNGFTEYLATYTVRGNVRWMLETEALPEGITALNVMGNWAATAATIATGQPTNGATVTVRVRVADGVAAGWQQQLKLEAQRAF